jgi:hypothetical protein
LQLLLSVERLLQEDAMLRFLFGAICGAFAAVYWRDDIRGYVSNKLPEVRARAADKLEALGKGAEDALHRAKSQIGSNLRGGGDRLRSAQRTASERWPGAE